MTRLSVNVDALVEHLERESGAASLAHRTNIEGFRRLAVEMMETSDYHTGGATAAKHDVIGWVVSYLSLQRDLASHAEISRVPTARPLFIIGFGRTGSTLVHDLLALDPTARTPRLWELMLPSPPPRPEGDTADPRIALVHRQLERMRATMPLALEIHPMCAEWPEECRWVMPNGPHIAVLHVAAKYWAWLKTLRHDQLAALYGTYRAQVQRLQLFHRGGYWLSKSSAHLHFYPVLFDLFPGARIVRLHRHPGAVVASACSLAAAVRAHYAQSCDLGRLGALVLDTFADGMARMIEADRHHAGADFIDLFYEDLVRAPAAAVGAARRAFGLEETPQLAAAVARYLAAPPRRSGFRHAYALEPFGLTRREVLARCEPYLSWVRQRFNVDLAA